MTTKHYTVDQLKEIRARYDFYIECHKDAIHKEKYHDGFGWEPGIQSEMLEECLLVRQIVDDRLTGNTILEESIIEIAIYPQERSYKKMVNGMRNIAIAALDAVRELSYGVKMVKCSLR